MKDERVAASALQNFQAVSGNLQKLILQLPFNAMIVKVMNMHASLTKSQNLHKTAYLWSREMILLQSRIYEKWGH
jgi:hypothetical protein